jgi:hypothetical protein
MQEKEKNQNDLFECFDKTLLTNYSFDDKINRLQDQILNLEGRISFYKDNKKPGGFFLLTNYKDYKEIFLENLYEIKKLIYKIISYMEELNKIIQPYILSNLKSSLIEDIKNIITTISDMKIRKSKSSEEKVIEKYSSKPFSQYIFAKIKDVNLKSFFLNFYKNDGYNFHEKFDAKIEILKKITKNEEIDTILSGQLLYISEFAQCMKSILTENIILFQYKFRIRIYREHYMLFKREFESSTDSAKKWDKMKEMEEKRKKIEERIKSQNLKKKVKTQGERSIV